MDIAPGREVTEDRGARPREGGRAALAPLLRDSQARWERYREAECKLAREGAAGGSAAAMAASACRWRLATARAAEVRADRQALAP